MNKRPLLHALFFWIVSFFQLRYEYWPYGTNAIPAVFHIIHKTDDTGNISDQVISDQLAVLNEDLRAISGSLGKYIGLSPMSLWCHRFD